MTNLTTTEIQTIKDCFKGLHNLNLIPDLPDSFEASLGGFKVQVANQLSHSELQQILDGFLEVDAAYQASATKLVLKNAGAAGIFPINLSTGIFALSSAIIMPTLTFQERTDISAAVKGISNLGAISEQQQTNLCHCLSELQLETPHVLTQNDLQLILNQLNEDGREIQVKNSLANPIDLQATHAQQAVSNAIVHPSLTTSQRGAYFIFIRDNCGAEPTTRQLSSLNKVMCTIEPNDKINHRLNAGELRSLTKIVEEGDDHVVDMSSDQTVMRVPKQSMWCFWSSTEEAVTPYSRNANVGSQLIVARGQLHDRMWNLDAAVTLSGIIIGAVVTLLEAIKEKLANDSSGEEALHYILLTLPIALGIISAVCGFYYTQTEKNFKSVTNNLNVLGYKTIDSDAPSEVLPVHTSAVPGRS